MKQTSETANVLKLEQIVCKMGIDMSCPYILNESILRNTEKQPISKFGYVY